MKVAPFQIEKSNCEFKTKLTWKETFSLYISVHNFIDGTMNCMSEPKTTFLKRNFNTGKLTQTLTWSSGGLCGIPWWQTNEKCLIELSWLPYWFVFVLLFLCTTVKESSPARFSVYQKKKRKKKVSGQNPLVPVKNQLIFFFFACKGFVL